MPLSPLYNSGDVTLISTFESSKLIEEWKKAFGIDITNELKDTKRINLFQCNQTKLLFFYPLSVAGSGELYKQLQNLDGYYMSHKWEHKTALKDLRDCKNVLEVGCAFGAFIETGLKAGINIRGIELNDAAVEVAHTKGLPVERIDLQEFASSYPESLDALCSFQVLEHVPKPKELIQYSIKSLRIGGKLIFCVPNAESYLKHQYNLLDMPPHHMHKWSVPTFKALEVLFPIKLERVVHEPLASYHVSGYLSSYRDYFRNKCLANALLFNRYTLILFDKLLQLGLRKYLTGQSLYVQFRKLS